MKKFFKLLISGDKAASAYKHGASLNIFILASVLLVVVLYVTFSTPNLVEREQITGTVLSVEVMKDDNRQYGWLIEVSLKNGKRTRLIMNRRPLPNKGDTIGLVKETYDNGETMINFDPAYIINPN